MRDRRLNNSNLPHPPRLTAIIIVKFKSSTTKRLSYFILNYNHLNLNFMCASSTNEKLIVLALIEERFSS